MKNGECIATSQTLAYLGGILSAIDFYRLNKSCIININYIKEIKKKSSVSIKKYVYLKHTESDVKLQIPPGKYTKLIEFIKANLAPDIIS